MNSMEIAQPDARLELVLNEALRSLSHQQGVLDNLRTRSTTLTAAAALVTSFLGAPAVSQTPALTWLTFSAIASMAGVLICTFIVCAPWWTWTFRTSASKLLDAVDSGHNIDSVRRNLASNLEQWLDENDAKLRVMQWWFTVGLALLLIELGAWIAHLELVQG